MKAQIETIINQLLLFKISRTEAVDRLNELKLIAIMAHSEGKLREVRKNSGLTLREVEEQTGISNAYLSQLENGKIEHPSFNVLNTLNDLYTR